MPRVKRFDETEVLNKAMRLFWKKGYAATSIQDLVEHLGINRASIYDTYGDKEQLFLKSFEHYRKTNRKGVEAFFEKHAQVKQGFLSLFEMAIDESIADREKKGCFVVNTTTELIPGDEQIVRILDENRKSFESLFFDYLKRGEEAGQFGQGKDLKALAALLFTLYNGLRVVSKVNTNREEMLDSVKLALALLEA